MLYIFKSKAAGDVIMLQTNGERILQIIGKEPGPKGIILPEQMPAAIAALQKAVTQGQGQVAQTPPTDQAQKTEGQDDTAADDRVSLRQRAAPFIDMLQRCHKEGREIVWGV
jgi:hypothetical protein